MSQAKKRKIEFGDYQTPIELTDIVVRKLIDLGIEPDVILEPTCGTGNFILSAANHFKLIDLIIGIEINPKYLNIAKNNCAIFDKHNIISR